MFFLFSVLLRFICIFVLFFYLYVFIHISFPNRILSQPITYYSLVSVRCFFASCISITCMRLFCASNLHLFYFQAIHYLYTVLPVVMSTSISFCACRMPGVACTSLYYLYVLLVPLAVSTSSSCLFYNH